MTGMGIEVECKILCWNAGLDWDIQTPLSVNECELRDEGTERLLSVSSYWNKIRLKFDGVDVVVAVDDLLEAVSRCDLFKQHVFGNELIDDRSRRLIKNGQGTAGFIHEECENCE